MDGAPEVPRGPTEPSAAAYAGAVVGGLLGAALGGVVWAIFLFVFHFYFGAIAFLVGIASGYGAHLLSGRRGGPGIQAIAAGCAVLGYLAGDYMVLAHGHIPWLLANKHIAAGYLDPVVWSYVWGNPDHHFGKFDVLWAAFAVWGAWITSARAR